MLHHRFSRTPLGSLVALSAVACLTFAVLPASAADNQPATKINAGTLTCKSKGGVGLIIGSKTTLNCVYKPSGKGTIRNYTGTVTKIGLDIGIKGSASWSRMYSSRQRASHASPS